MQLARRAYVLVLTVKPKSQWDPCGSESVHRMTYLWLSRVKHRFSKVVLRCPEFQLYGHALFILVRHRYSYHCGWIPVYCCHISGRRQEGCSWSETRIHKEVQTLRHLLNALKMSRSSNILSWHMVLFHVSFFFNQMMSLYTNIPWYTVSSSLFLHCAFQCDSLSKRVGKGRRLNQTLLTWIWPQSIPWGSFFFFCPSEICEFSLINLQQIREDHGGRPSTEAVWKRDSTTTDTILPDCGFIKGWRNEQSSNLLS